MKYLPLLYAFLLPSMGAAQSVSWISSTDNAFWQKQKNVSLASRPARTPLLSVGKDSSGHILKHWGTTFNELDWDAFLALSRDEQDKLMYDLFSPDGDLKFTRGASR